MNREEITGELLEYGEGRGRIDCGKLPLNEFEYILLTGLRNLERLTYFREGLELLFHPFIADAYNGIITGVFLENALEFHESTLISNRHPVDFIKDEAEITGSLGPEKVGDIATVQEGYEGFFHGGLVTVLGRIPFHDTVSGGFKGGVGECGLTDAWGTVEK